MKVILLEELQGKGGEGDVVEVSRGFANNYLLKNRIAIPATDGNLKQLEQRRKNIAKREEVRIADANEMKEKLDRMTITIAAKTGEEGQLFGSVTPQMIADTVAAGKQGLEIDRRRVVIPSPIKTLGEHKVEVSIYRDIKAELTVQVVDVDAPETEEVAEEAVAEEAVEAVAEEAAEEAAEVEEQ